MKNDDYDSFFVSAAAWWWSASCGFAVLVVGGVVQPVVVLAVIFLEFFAHGQCVVCFFRIACPWATNERDPGRRGQHESRHQRWPLRATLAPSYLPCSPEVRGGFASPRLSIGTLTKARSEVSAKEPPKAHSDVVGDVVRNVGREMKSVCCVDVLDRAWEAVCDIRVQIVHGEPLLRKIEVFVHRALLALIFPQQVTVADGFVPENGERGLPHYVRRAVLPRA